MKKWRKMKALLAGGFLFFLVLMLAVSYYELRKILPETSMDQQRMPEDPEEAAVARMDASNLLTHASELLRIKRSVLQQLRELEEKCSAVSLDVTKLVLRVEELKFEIVKLNATAEFLRSSNRHQEITHEELKQRMSPKAVKPLRLMADSSDNYVMQPLSKNRSLSCTMEKCFDYSRCPLTSGFPIFVDQSGLNSGCKEVGDAFMSQMEEAMHQSGYADATVVQACLHVAFVCKVEDLERLVRSEAWRGDGRNHLIFLGEFFPVGAMENFGRAMLSGVTVQNFRPNFDLQGISQHDLPGDIKQQDALPFMVPARRRRLLFFSGSYRSTNNGTSPVWKDPLMKTLREMSDFSTSSSGIHLFFSCNTSAGLNCQNDTWCMCDSREVYGEKLAESTFSLVIWKEEGLDCVGVHRVLLGIKNGAIPVLLGSPHLPLEENVDWSRALIRLPRARATELHTVLRSIRDEDVLAYRLHGRRIWENYFSSSKAFADALLDTIRVRLNIPALPATEFALINFHNQTSQSSSSWQDVVLRTDLEENLGPVEPPYPSDCFQRNFTSTSLAGYDSWNVLFDVGRLFPFTPFSPVLPTDAQFLGSEFGFRPIAGGAGGTGHEFSEAIGGNRPREQFTIVILTYQREAILSATVARLNNLPYLNKVVIVWNSQLEPTELLVIPKIHVPIVIHKASVNSLNNRFVPFNAIETEAILSMDDDVYLRHDEIVFAFRVWRENRDRIVGFPARYHAWDSEHNSWLYNSNYTCEFSMILTGAAFFHKYFAFLYTSVMPAAIRAKVDEFTNCEDIAMNFLISHHTRKPPIKVTSRWTFHCLDCPISLWEDDSHFSERHSCMHFFEKIYGYMPLLNSQFRADSVLYKTKIPADKQKCYRNV